MEGGCPRIRALASVRFSVNWRKFAACDGKKFQPFRQPWRKKIVDWSKEAKLKRGKLRLGDARTAHCRKATHCLFCYCHDCWRLCVGTLSHTIISLKTRFSRSHSKNSAFYELCLESWHSSKPNLYASVPGLAVLQIIFARPAAPLATTQGATAKRTGTSYYPQIVWSKT